MRDCVVSACDIDLIVAVYDLLAPHYDAVTGDSSTETVFIDSIIRHAHPHPVTLLEVACGTGVIIASLADRYQVAGLDLSPGMLAVARQKLPAGTPLYVADMSNFQLNVKFDAVVCVYHGINHLTDFATWQGFFDCVHRHLNDGGVFVFDTYPVDSLRMMAGAQEVVQQFGENHHLRIRVRANDEAVFDWNIELFERQRGDSHKFLTEVIRIATFPSERIREALSERFANIKLVESGAGGHDDTEKRTWFTCTKP